MRPLLFLDVDGVLNIEPHETAVPHDEHHPGSAEHVFIPKGTKARVAELLEIFEPVWCTAWLGRAHATFKPLLDLKRRVLAKFVAATANEAVGVAPWGAPWWEVRNLGRIACVVSVDLQLDSLASLDPQPARGAVVAFRSLRS